MQDVRVVAFIVALLWLLVSLMLAAVWGVVGWRNKRRKARQRRQWR